MKQIIKVVYKTGASVTDCVHYVHTENGCLYYTVDRQVEPVIQEPVRIPLENITGYKVTVLTDEELSALEKALENCGVEDVNHWKVAKYYVDSTVSIDTCRNGRDVAWCIWSEDKQSAVYVDTLEELTEDEIEKELC